MNKHQQEIHEQYLDLFNNEGWKHWIKTVQHYKDNVINKAPYEVDNAFKAGQVRGGVEVLDMVLSLEMTIERNTEEIEENQEEEV